MLELVLGFFVCLTATLRGFLVVRIHPPEGVQAALCCSHRLLRLGSSSEAQFFLQIDPVPRDTAQEAAHLSRLFQRGWTASSEHIDSVAHVGFPFPRSGCELREHAAAEVYHVAGSTV